MASDVGVIACADTKAPRDESSLKGESHTSRYDSYARRITAREIKYRRYLEENHRTPDGQNKPRPTPLPNVEYKECNVNHCQKSSPPTEVVPGEEIVSDLHDADYGDESRSVEWVVLEAPISPDVLATDETFKDFVHLTKRTELPLRAASFGFGSSFTPATQHY